MNYQLIKILCKRRGMTETKLIGFTGMSVPGYYLMLKKQTMTTLVLEKISEALNVNPCIFFKEELQSPEPEDINLSLAIDPIVNYKTNSAIKQKPTESVELIELMRFKINTLEKELQELKVKSKPEQ